MASLLVFITNNLFLAPMRFVTNLFQTVQSHLLTQGDLAEVVRGSGMGAIIRTSAMALNYLLTILLARWMGASEYGVYAFAFALVTLLVLPATLGLPAASARFIPEYRIRHQWGMLRGLWRAGPLLILASSGAIMLMGIGITTLSSDGNNPYFWPVTVVLIGIPVLALGAWISDLARAHGWIELSYIPPQVGQAVVLLSFAVFLSAMGALTAVHMVTALVGGSALVFSIQSYVLKGRLQPEFKRGPASYEIGRWLKVSFPLVLYYGSYLISLNADLVMVGFLKQAEDVGHYNAAARTSILIIFFLQTFGHVAEPRIARLFAEGMRNELEHFLERLIHWIFWPTVAAAAVLLLFGRWILSIYGEGFQVAEWPLLILAVGYLVQTAFGPLGAILNMTGHHLTCSRVLIGSAALNILLNALLIPIYGILGAAMATASAGIVSSIWLLVIAKRKLDLNPTIMSALYI